MFSLKMLGAGAVAQLKRSLIPKRTPHAQGRTGGSRGHM
jgi:hypothetical protein